MIRRAIDSLFRSEVEEEEDADPEYRYQEIPIPIPPDDDPRTWSGVREDREPDPPPPGTPWPTFIRFPGIGYRLGSLEEVAVPQHPAPPVAPIAAAAAAAAPDPAMAAAAQNVRTNEKTIPLFVDNPPDNIPGVATDGEWHLEVPESWLKDERNWTPDFLDLFIQGDTSMTPALRRLFRSAPPEARNRILGYFNDQLLPDVIREKLQSTRLHNFQQVFDLGTNPAGFEELGQMYSRLFFNVLSKNIKPATRAVSLFDLILCGVIDPVTFLTPDILTYIRLRVSLRELASVFDLRNIGIFRGGKPWKDLIKTIPHRNINTYSGEGPFFAPRISIPHERYNDSMFGLYCCIHNIFLVDLDPQNMAEPCITCFFKKLKSQGGVMKTCLDTLTNGKDITYIRALAFYINWFFSYRDSSPELRTTLQVQKALIASWNRLKLTINDSALRTEFENSFINAPKTAKGGLRLNFTETNMEDFLCIMNYYQFFITDWLLHEGEADVKLYLGRAGNRNLPYINPRFASCLTLQQIKTPSLSYNQYSLYYHPELWASSKTPIYPVNSLDYSPPVSSWSASVANRLAPLPDLYPTVDPPNTLINHAFAYRRGGDFRDQTYFQEEWPTFTYRNIPEYIYNVIQMDNYYYHGNTIYTFNNQGVVLSRRSEDDDSNPPRTYEGVRDGFVKDPKTNGRKADKVARELFSHWVPDYLTNHIGIRLPDVFIPPDIRVVGNEIELYRSKRDPSPIFFSSLFSASFGSDVSGMWCRLLTQYASRKNMEKFRKAKQKQDQFVPGPGKDWVVDYPPIYTCSSAVRNIFNSFDINKFSRDYLEFVHDEIDRVIIYTVLSTKIDLPNTDDFVHEAAVGGHAGSSHAMVIGFDKPTNSIIVYDSSRYVHDLLTLSSVLEMRNSEAWRNLDLDVPLHSNLNILTPEERGKYNATLRSLIPSKPGDPNYPADDDEARNVINDVIQTVALTYERDRVASTMRGFRALLAYHVWATCRAPNGDALLDPARINDLTFAEICQFAADHDNPFNFQFSLGNQLEGNKCGTYACYAAMFLTMQPRYTFVPQLAAPSYNPLPSHFNSVSETSEQFLMYMAMCLERGEIVSSREVLREQVRKFLRLKLRRQFSLSDYLSTWVPPALKRRRREDPDPPPPPPPAAAAP
ncbi:MAG: hypothetical protein J6S85_06010 [Methanobrevibacter sp.]|nr:hypothetical protein [Methanobrevibacter sp.]